MREYINKVKYFLIEEISQIKDLIIKNRIITLAFGFIMLLFFFSYIIESPRNFSDELVITIEEGSTVKEVSNILKEKGAIRSRTIFNILVHKNNILAGDYLFNERESIFTVANRLKSGDYGIPLVSVTLTEGMTVMEMAERLDYYIDDFNTDNFINLALKYEGYLFPDTYKFSGTADEVEIIATMRDNFNDKVTELRDRIEESDRTLDEIITMASIVEKEATRDTIQEVSDVLWHRMDIGMALQVDATFVYSIGKNSFTVTKDEIKDDDNLYNTYTHLGLPPTPISNPGLDAIIASIESNPTDYLYFLTGRDGEMYFATSFEGHKQNRARYLD